MPEYIHWTLKLTAPRVKALLVNSSKKLGFNEALFEKSNFIIAEALEGNDYLTMQGLKEY